VNLFVQQSLHLNCHVGTMLVFCMLCRITQSLKVHRTESVSLMDHNHEKISNCWNFYQWCVKSISISAGVNILGLWRRSFTL